MEATDCNSPSVKKSQTSNLWANKSRPKHGFSRYHQIHLPLRKNLTCSPLQWRACTPAGSQKGEYSVSLNKWNWKPNCGRPVNDIVSSLRKWEMKAWQKKTSATMRRKYRLYLPASTFTNCSSRKNGSDGNWSSWIWRHRRCYASKCGQRNRKQGRGSFGGRRGLITSVKSTLDAPFSSASVGFYVKG